MPPKRSSLDQKDLRVRTPKVSEDYDKAIDEYAGSGHRNPKSAKLKAQKARKAAEDRLQNGSKMERCLAIIKLLTLREDSYWFLEPVPVEDVPDYLDIVEEPMDYATIRSKIKSGAYHDDHIAFATDVRRVFTNAVKYNWSPEHPCNIAARAGLRDFEQLLVKVTSAGLDAAAGPPQHALPSRKRHRQSFGAGGSTPAPAGRSSEVDPASADTTGGSGGKKARMRGSASEASSSDRDQQLIAGLAEYIETCGGTRDMVGGWYTRTEVRKGGGTAGTFDTYFFSPTGKRFRSRAEIARFFKLEAAPAKSAKSVNVEERKAVKAAEREAKRIQKELAAAQRQAELEAQRALRNRYPLPDEQLVNEPPPDPPLRPRPLPLPPYVEGISPSEIGDVLQVCDFLRLLSSNLQLPSYTPSELVSALQISEGEPNAKLADLLQALLQLVLTDKSIREWWGEVMPAPVVPKPKSASAKAPGPKSAGKPKWWEEDAKPHFKCDLEAILNTSEPTSKTRRWVAQLETIAPMRTNTGVPIRQAVVTAKAITTDPEVRRYLDRTLAAWRGNAAGRTKFGALWLASQVRRKRPQIWASGEMADVEAPAEAPLAGSTTPVADDDGVGSEIAPSDMGASERTDDEAEDEDGEDEGDDGAGEEDGDDGEVLEGPEEVDCKLWEGAAAEGWRVRRKGDSDHVDDECAFLGPSGEKYMSKAAAEAARTQEASRLAQPDTHIMHEPSSVGEHPEDLVGCRVLVQWELDNTETDGEEAWYAGQLWEYDPTSKEYHILYDDNSEERLDLRKTNYKVLYRLRAPYLYRSQKPPIPDVSDVTAYSWPPLLAAVVLRLIRQWDPNTDVDDAPVTAGAVKEEGETKKESPGLEGLIGPSKAVKSDGRAISCPDPQLSVKSQWQISNAGDGSTDASSQPQMTSEEQTTVKSEGKAISVERDGRGTSADGQGHLFVSGTAESFAPDGAASPRTAAPLPDPMDVDGPSSTTAPSPRARMRRDGDALVPSSPRVPTPSLAGGARVSPPAEGMQSALRLLLSTPPSASHEAYSRLSPSQKLGLLRVLIDGVCDSPHTIRAIDSIMTARRELLDKEEDAEREKRRLVRAMREEARHFLKEQLAADREAATEAAAERGDSPPDDALIEVTDVQVGLEVQKRIEMQACGGEVTVLTRDELQHTEADLATELELQVANGIDKDGYDLSDADMEGIIARRDLLKLRRDTFGELRDAAQAQLRAALASSDASQMEKALRSAIVAALEGDSDEDGIGPGGRWLTVETKDVYVALAELNKAKEERLAAGRRQMELSKVVVRSEPLGRDRYGRRYWWLVPVEGKMSEPHIWCEPRTAEVIGGMHEPPTEAYQQVTGISDEPGRRCDRQDWQQFVGVEACNAIAASLDDRGIAERRLKQSLQRHLQDFENKKLAEAEDEVQ